MKTILIFGGNSDERLVSTASAQNLCQRFSFAEIWYVSPNSIIHHISKEELLAHKDPFLNEFKTVTPPADGLEKGLESAHGKVFFLAFHGKEGEDGTIQAILEKKKIPFTGSGALASAQSFDKIQAKRIVQEKNLPCAPEMVVSSESELKDFFYQHKKIVVKPIANGSSVGLHILETEEAFFKALPLIINSKFAMMAEKFLEGREMTVGVMAKENGEVIPLPPSEVVLSGTNAFDFHGKYLGRGTKEITPAEVTEKEKKELQQLALAAHKALNCYGYSRTDIILTNSGPVYLETNTLPGLTKASFIPQQLEVIHMSMEDFIKTQLALALKRYG